MLSLMGLNKSNTQFNQAAAAKLLADDSTFATTLMVLCIDLYGDDVFTDDPVVLFKNLEEDLGGKLSEANEQKLQAAITCITTDLFQTNPQMFNKLCLALNTGDIGDEESDDSDDLDACKLLWSLTEVGLLTDQTYEQLEESMSDSVVNAFNEVIDNEAQDLEEVDDDVDTIEEALSTPYYKRYVVANILELARQLLSIGANQQVVAELLAEHRQSLESIQTEIQ